MSWLFLIAHNQNMLNFNAVTGNLEKQYTKSTHTKNIEQGSVSQKVRKNLFVFTGPMKSRDDVFSKCNFFKALKLGLDSCISHHTKFSELYIAIISGNNY